MEGIIVVNGEIQKPESASIPALDRGFLFGDNVFEVLVAFKGKVLDLDKHLARLRHSADQLDLPLPWSDEELAFELQHVATQADFPKAYLRIVVTRGSGTGLEVPDEIQPHKIIYGFPAKVADGSLYTHGMALQMRSLPHTERGPMAKTGNYLRSILALKKAKKDGFNDVIWTNSEGEVTEATTANIFFIGRQGDLVDIVTPSVQSGILKGITRQTVMEMLGVAGIASSETIIDQDELARFDEAFVCSTVRGLVPVSRINQHRFHTMRPTSTFSHINRLYMAWVAREIGYRADWNTGKFLGPLGASQD